MRFKYGLFIGLVIASLWTTGRALAQTKAQIAELEAEFGIKFETELESKIESERILKAIPLLEKEGHLKEFTEELVKDGLKLEKRSTKCYFENIAFKEELEKVKAENKELKEANIILVDKIPEKCRNIQKTITDLIVCRDTVKICTGMIEKKPVSKKKLNKYLDKLEESLKKENSGN